MQLVSHYACMFLTTVLSQYFCYYIDRLLLGLVFWATISAPRAWLSCPLLYCIIVIVFYNLSILNMIWWYDAMIVGHETFTQSQSISLLGDQKSIRLLKYATLVPIYVPISWPYPACIGNFWKV